MTAQDIKKQISIFLKQPVERLQDNVSLTALVSDSFILVEMVMYLQDEFEVRIIQDDLKDVKTIGGLVALFLSKQT